MAAITIFRDFGAQITIVCSKKISFGIKRKQIVHFMGFLWSLTFIKHISIWTWTALLVYWFTVNNDTLSRNWRRQWHPTLVLLPGKSHGWRSLESCSPWGRWESDTTERLHFHFSLSCIGEGDGNPLQCSCLENPRDGGAWWAAVCGVTQSRTRLKRLSSSSSSSCGIQA